jgi:hypothetical protein
VEVYYLIGVALFCSSGLVHRLGGETTDRHVQVALSPVALRRGEVRVPGRRSPFKVRIRRVRVLPYKKFIVLIMRYKL